MTLGRLTLREANALAAGLRVSAGQADRQVPLCKLADPLSFGRESQHASREGAHPTPKGRVSLFLPATVCQLMNTIAHEHNFSFQSVPFLKLSSCSTSILSEFLVLASVKVHALHRWMASQMAQPFPRPESGSYAPGLPTRTERGEGEQPRAWICQA